jgi:nickel-dependent lactate racemase
VIGLSHVDRGLTEEEVREALGRGFAGLPLTNQRLLVLIPDGTRHAPIAMLFRLLLEQVGKQARRLDFLIALGTHPPMTPAAIDRLVGMPASERRTLHPNVSVFNHVWNREDHLFRIGTIPGDEIAELSGGLMHESIPVDLNRIILDYDQLVICGPVFPHEVAGFSGGAKYIFPGIAGPPVISATHWLGALGTSMRTIGVKDTAVRRVIHRAAELVPKPVLCIALAAKGDRLHGLFVGDHVEAWSHAADVAAQLFIQRIPQGFQRVLSMPSTIYRDLWTAAKAMYKTEPAVVDGGEVVIFAPHVTEVSYTHGKLIDQVGYHVLQYFTAQPGRFAGLSGVIKAHSTHVKGLGTYDLGSREERPRIRVTLATGIPEERCLAVNLGYLNPRSIDPSAWEGRRGEGIAVIHDAGETLYRADDVGL